jgi:hypothetical protein
MQPQWLLAGSNRSAAAGWRSGALTEERSGKPDKADLATLPLSVASNGMLPPTALVSEAQEGYI